MLPEVVPELPKQEIGCYRLAICLCEMLEGMRGVLLCMLEVLEVPEMPEAMRCVLLHMPEVMRCVLLHMLEVLEVLYQNRLANNVWCGL